MSKKKLLFVINSLGQGGAEKSLTSMLPLIDFEKYEVDLLMFRATGMFLRLLPEQVTVLPELEFLEKTKISDFKVWFAKKMASVGLRLNNKNRVLHDAQCYWKYTHKYWDALKKEYDVAVAWGQGNPTHYVAEKVKAKKKIAFINANYEAAGHNREFDLPYYSNYDYLVTVSDELKKITEEVFPEFKDKIQTIYDINNAQVIEKMADEERPFARECGEIIIVTVGRLVKQKGYDLAVEACKILKDAEFDFKWFIVGEGLERKFIEAGIQKFGLENNLFLVGAKDNPYVYMKNADLYVQSSKTEGYCLTLGEARILNVPVISTNFDVVYNQLRDGENGLIVPMDGKAIAAAIVRLWKDEALREHIVNTLKSEKKGNVEEINKFYELIER